MKQEHNKLWGKGFLASSVCLLSAVYCIPTHEKLTSSSTPIEVQPFQEIPIDFVHHWGDNRHPFSGATSTVALAVAAPAYANELPATVMGTASAPLVTLATTGNPDP